VIWPCGQEFLEEAARQTRAPPVRPLIDITVTTLVEAAASIEVFDSSLFDEVRRLPSFKKILRRVLQEKSASLGQSRSTAQLLALAFEGETHLDLVGFRGLSAKTISDALERDELEQIETLGVCVDFLSSMPVDVAFMLSTYLSLSEIHLLQPATREDDKLSIQTLLELFKYIEKAPHVPKLFVSGVYSAALRHKAWLPQEYTVPTSIAPVQCVFIRTLMNKGVPRKLWLWQSLYIGDGLLNPHQLAAGLLKWLKMPDFGFYAFATGPPTLKDCDTSRVELTPIPADNFADDGGYKSSLPATAQLVPGSSHVLVSDQMHWDQEADERNGRTSGWEPMSFRYVRFAFIQISNDFNQQNATPDTPLCLTKEDVSVRGLKEFLDTTASKNEGLGVEIESASIERRLRELGESIARAHGQGQRPADLEVVDVMSEDEVCEALNEMLQELK
jgi:hypothetical protein